MKIFSLLNKFLFYHCGKGVVIDPSCEINQHQYISLGNNVCIGRESWIDCPVENLAQKKAKPIIIIEDGVDIGRRAVISGLSKIHLHKNILLSPNVYISDHSHQYQKTTLPVKLQGVTEIKPVEIGENSWIGINACLLPGSKIGKGCVVGANSVVSQSFPDYCTIAGAPARIVKKYDGSRWVRVK